MMCRNRGLRLEQEFIKRTLDITVAVIGIVLTSPIMLITALAIKICDGGPVFFKQNRVTKGGKIFNVLKFRSMIVDADKDGAKKAESGDDRITPVGKIIRPVRIDELPQFFNILFGDMSLVGPRPERVENVYEYTKMYPDFNLRHRVKGGLTGYAQIYGKYNTTPEDKLKMDLIYIEQYSIFLDIKLLLMTIKILFMKESTEGFDAKANANVKPIDKRKEEDK
jgi:exopolysaccharide biosynthesis polyprenyl glycosylphosphotransferase